MASGAEEFKAFEAAGWSRRASTYGRVSGAITARFVDSLLDGARVGAGMRVLDVATGPGHVAAAAAARGAEPVGVDIAEGMLAVARRDHPQLDFRPGDAEALPFADSAFDAVVGAFVLNHLPRPEVAAAELARVLAPGGRLALSVWDVPERTRFIGLVRDAVARGGQAPSAEPSAGPDPFRFADDAQLRALLDGAGLEDAAVETVAVCHRVEGDAMALWDGLLAGSVRSAAAVEALSPAARERARAAFAELVEPHRVAGGHELPAVAKGGLRAPAVSVADALRAGLESGDFCALGECYADDAVLDLNVRGGRERIAGPAAIVARLERLFPGRGRLVEWTAAVHDAGATVWLERVSDADGAVLRQRQYLLLRDGRVRRQFAYTAPHRTGVAGLGGRPAFDPALIGGLGDIAEHTVLASRGWSGNALERVLLADGRVLIAKRIVPGADWIGRASADPGREGLLFTGGVLDRLPPALDHATIAAARDGDAWWLVMRNVSDELLDDHSIVSREANQRLLTAVNAMWDGFWGERLEFLAPQAVRLQMAAPSISGRERDGVDLLPKQLEVMWEAFTEAVEPDVAGVVLALVENAAPLAAALDARGTTLLHGDIRDEQIGLLGPRLVLLDWGLATQGHPVVDYAWHLMHSAWRIDATHDQLWQDFRAARGARDDPLAVELGMIAGLVMYGWILGHSAVIHPDPAERTWARAELDWWVPRTRHALDTWSPA